MRANRNRQVLVDSRIVGSDVLLRQSVEIDNEIATVSVEYVLAACVRSNNRRETIWIKAEIRQFQGSQPKPLSDQNHALKTHCSIRAELSRTAHANAHRQITVNHAIRSLQFDVISVQSALFFRDDAMQ